jgi:uncharacterized protein (TIGR02145 family)
MKSNILFCFAVIVLIATHLSAQNTNPVVSNVVFNISGTTVTVTYDVYDSEQSTVTIIMKVSSNAGAAWDFNSYVASGDVGTGITIGTGKTITWPYFGEPNDFFKVRIYAYDETADGSPCQGITTVYYMGKTYNTIQIGTQCWLKENLDVGTMIQGNQNQDNNGILEKYCYDDDTVNCNTYGGLYQWNEAMQFVATPGTKGICPTGWHIPTYAELQTLVNVVGKFAPYNAGNSLKALGQGYGSGVGTNKSGFNALMSGHRLDLGSSFFSEKGFNTYFWSSTEFGTNTAYNFKLYADDNGGSFGNYTKYNEGNCIRCIKD